MTKKRLPRKLRRLVGERAKGYCEYCLCPEFCATQFHSIEHIEPESLGGSSQEDNLALVCQGCNGSKSNKTQALDPVPGRRVPLFQPRRDDWHEPFAWSSDQLRLIGLTLTGRVTIRELDLNRDGVVRLRRMLIFDQEHPPAHRSSK